VSITTRTAGLSQSGPRWASNLRPNGQARWRVVRAGCLEWNGGAVARSTRGVGETSFVLLGIADPGYIFRSR